MSDKSPRSLTGRLFGFLRSAPEPAAPDAAPPTTAAALPHAEEVLAATDVPLLVLHEDGVLGGLNPAAERLTGYAADEVVGRRWQILFPAAVLAELGEAPLPALLGGGHPGALALRRSTWSAPSPRRRSERRRRLPTHSPPRPSTPSPRPRSRSTPKAG